MKAWLDEIAASLRGALSVPVVAAFPDAPLPEEPPVVTVGLSRVRLNPAGMGDKTAQLAEAVFLISLYEGTAERCAREAIPLPGLLPGLALLAHGAAFDPETRWFVIRVELTRRAYWPLETPPQEDLLRIDRGGKILHELDP